MTETTECWRCGHQRYVFESCMRCGASCKPLTRAKQEDGWGGNDTDWWSEQQREDGR